MHFLFVDWINTWHFVQHNDLYGGFGIYSHFSFLFDFEILLLLLFTPFCILKHIKVRELIENGILIIKIIKHVVANCPNFSSLYFLYLLFYVVGAVYCNSSRHQTTVFKWYFSSSIYGLYFVRLARDGCFKVMDSGNILACGIDSFDAGGCQLIFCSCKFLVYD